MASRSVRLTSPERVLFPDEGITKQDLFEYYRAIAPVLIPHLRDRPFTMKRNPYGERFIVNGRLRRCGTSTGAIAR